MSIFVPTGENGEEVRESGTPETFPDSSSRRSFDRIARLAARQFDVAVTMATLVEDDRQRFIAAYGPRIPGTERVGAFCARTIRENDVFVVPDASKDPVFRDNSLVRKGPHIRFYAGVPLKRTDGRTVGTLCVMDVKPRSGLSDREKAILLDLAETMVDILETRTVCARKTALSPATRTRITSQKSLPSTEQQLCLLFENAPVAFAMFNQDMEYLAASHKWREIFQLENEDIFGRSHYALAPDLPARWKADNERCLRGVAQRWEEDCFHRSDGTVEWVTRELHPWYHPNGDVGGIIVFNEVITDWKRAATELEHSKRFLDSILESIQEGIVACDERGRLSVFNSAAKRMLKADAMPIPPAQWASKYHIYEANGKSLVRTKDLPLVQAMNEEVVENRELVLGPPNGQRRRIICNGRALATRGGAKVGAVVSMQDITEKSEIEAQYRQAQKMEAVGQLTGGLAHDFNNLLAVILGNLQLLERLAGKDRKSARRLNAAIAAARRGAELTNRLLSFARKQRHQPRTIDTNALISQLQGLLSRTLGKAVSLETKLDESLWPIHTDEIQLEAALLNLVLNARDAMAEGGCVTIETKNFTIGKDRLSPDTDLSCGDYVLISVSDRGSGMREDVKSRVFEPFFTTKDVGKGSGLGLSMVYGFIKQSGGHIEIQSREGYGTNVSMYFPRCPDSPEPTEPPEPPGPRHRASSGEPEAHCESQRILVVEDEPAVREVTVALLEDLGHEVTEAGSGQSALDILRSSPEKFDLLLTDIVMPGALNGLALAKVAKKEFPDLKILFMSGYPDSAYSRKGIIAGGIDLIDKPVRRDELARKIRKTTDHMPP